MATAKAEWKAAYPSASFAGFSASVGDLPGLQLGSEGGGSVVIDRDAAGWGWGAGGMNLLTVVRHEIGHFLGLGHGGGVMSATLSPGQSFPVDASDLPKPASEDPPASSSGSSGSDKAADKAADKATDKPADKPADQPAAAPSGSSSSAPATDASGSGQSQDAAPPASTTAGGTTSTGTTTATGSTGSTGSTAAGAGASSTHSAATASATESASTQASPQSMAALVTALAAGPVVVTQTGDAHVSVSGGIVSVTGDDPTVTFQLSDATSISITSSKTLAVDGDLMVPGVPVSLKAKKITVAGRTIDSGTADVAITAEDSASGTNLLGVILDASTDAQVIITSARIRGRTIVITATATSTPDTTSGSGAGPVAQITATASATVVVSGDSVIAGTGDVTLSSKAVMQANATSDGLPSSLSSTANAAIAVPVLTTKAITQVTGTSSVTSDGLLTVSSDATTNVKANANAKDSPAGGAIAIAVVDITSHAFIDSTGPASSGSSVTVNATSDTTIDTSAIASVGGASENKDKDGNPTTADNLADGNGKVTPAGGSATQSIPVAASLAFTHLTSDTAAWVGPTGSPNPSTVIANGPAGVVTISSSSGNHLSSSADSSAVKASSASTSVGVGLAVTVANVNHKSFVTGSANIRGPTVRILATMPTTGTTQDSYTTTATSGVGDATTVAIAGSLALNVITLNRSATIADNAHLDTAYGPALDQLGDVTLTAASSSTSTTKATAHSDVFDPATAVDADNQTITLPYGLKSGSSAITTGTAVTYSTGGGTPIGGLADGGTYYAIVVSATDTETKLKLAASASDATNGTAITLDKSKATGAEHTIGTETSAQGVGIGASFGINIVGDTTTAGIGTGAQLTRAGALTVSATTTDALVNLAENGSQGAQAITPVVAVSISNVTTTAQLGTGPAVTLGGAASLRATQTASATTTATGDTEASSAAIGASIAILSANHTVRATTLRNLSAGGDVTLAAHGTSTTVSSATASAAGADDSSSSHGTSQDVNGQSDSQLGGANAAATRNGATGSKDSSTPAASTADSDGNGGSSSVSVAAAVVFNLVHATAEASLAEGVTVTATGLATLDASVNTDASAEADGQASTQGGTASIGAAVGINRASSTTSPPSGPAAPSPPRASSSRRRSPR